MFFCFFCLQVKLVVQKEIQAGAVLQQDFIVEYVIASQMCDDCHRVEAKDYWRAVVQVGLSLTISKPHFSYHGLFRDDSIVSINLCIWYTL